MQAWAKQEAYLLLKHLLKNTFLILIHASQGKAGSIFASEPSFKKYIPDFKKLPFGAIIGEAMITDVIRIENLEMNDELINRLTMEEKAFGDYSEGRYAWMLEDAVEYSTPIPARGTLSIWEYPDENMRDVLR